MREDVQCTSLEIKIPTEPDAEAYIEVAQCPHCGGLFGVDISFLEAEDGYCHCPMCCEEVNIPCDTVGSFGNDKLIITPGE